MDAMMSSKTNACVWSSMFSSKNTAFAQEVLFILNSCPDELLEMCEDADQEGSASSHRIAGFLHSKR